MSDGVDVEKKWKCARWVEEEDHSKETTAALEQVNAENIQLLLRSTNISLEDYLGQLYAVERRARFGGDAISTQRLAVEITKIHRILGLYDEMFNTIDILMRKRGQFKQVQTAMVTEAQLILTADASLDRAKRIDYLSRLKFLAEGKIHLELENARYGMQLAVFFEEDGRLKEASDLLLAVQVETVTSMPRLEKIKCVLKQLQLALDRDDSSRVAMLSRKLNNRALAKDDTRVAKIEYFLCMALYYERSQAYTAMARCWYEIFLTIPEEAVDFAKLMASADGGSFFSTAARSSVVRALEHPESKVHALSNAIVFALMAPHLPAKDVEDMCECCAFSKESTQNGDGYTWLPKLLQLKFVASDLPGLERILRAFTTQELIRVSLCATVEELCHTHSVLKGRPERRDALMCRLSEHDILCVSKFYKRIRLSRLAELVGLSQDQTENFVMLLVNTNTIYAKMDRIDAVVVFKKQLNPVDVVDQWNTGVEKITALVDRATHLIAKERMIARSEGH